MLKFYSDTKIYVPCPAGVVTGGAELLHQLVDYLRNNEREAYIVYFGEGNHSLPDDYKCYNIRIAEQIEDSEHNVEVIYEGIINTAFERQKIQKVLWWLSVDNFYICCSSYLNPIDYMVYDYKKGFKMLIRRILKSIYVWRNLFKDTISINDLANLNAVNAYQSEYAQWWLTKKHFPNILPLKDYINIEHCQKYEKSIKQDIVLYNPKKGIEFTQSLIAAAPDIQWIPLQGMSRAKLIDTMIKAKVYVDFGYHPGKDRLPRECAMNGCCIITGKRGSAAFFEDVSIMDQYKFDEKHAKIEDIISTIRILLKNYHTTIDDYRYYRASIAYEKEEFESQIKKLFLI